MLAGATASFPFLAGHVTNTQQLMDIVVNRSGLPKGAPVQLALDEDNDYFPQIDIDDTRGYDPADDCGGLVFLDRTRVLTHFGCCHGVLTLEKGSRFDCVTKRRVGKVTVTGGEVILRGTKRFVDIRDDVAIVRMEKPPKQVVPLLLQVQIPTGTRQGTQLPLSVAQRDDNRQVVGGASVICLIG